MGYDKAPVDCSQEDGSGVRIDVRVQRNLKIPGPKRKVVWPTFDPTAVVDYTELEGEEEG